MGGMGGERARGRGREGEANRVRACAREWCIIGNRATRRRYREESAEQ